MTGRGKKERAALDRLADAFVDDILRASDEDILSEFKDVCGDPMQNASEMRALFEKSVLLSNKKRLASAKAAVAHSRQNSRVLIKNPIDIETARARLRAIIDTPGLPAKVTMAARKESELSDADILGIVDDLRELGVELSDDEGNGKQ